MEETLACQTPTAGLTSWAAPMTAGHEDAKSEEGF